MATTVIIGYGSTLRCDDGIGFLAAEALMDLLPEDQYEVIARQQLTPDLADSLSRCDRVIFIDAHAGDAPGEIRTQPVIPTGKQWGAFVHEMAPDVLLDCVKQIFGKAPEAQLITIGVASLEIGQGLTPLVASALPRVIALVQSQLPQLPVFQP